MANLVHFEGEFPDLGLGALLWHVDDFEEYVFAAVFPLEGNDFVYNIEF